MKLRNRRTLWIAAAVLSFEVLTCCIALAWTTPNVSAKAAFAEGKAPEIIIDITNQSSVQETFTAVADIFYANGQRVAHLFSSPATFSPNQHRQFILSHDLPTGGNYFVEVSVYDAEGVQRFNQKLITFFLSGTVQLCPPDCNIQ